MINRTRLHEANEHLQRAHSYLTSVLTAVSLADETGAMRELPTETVNAIEDGWRTQITVVQIDVSAVAMLFGKKK